MQSDSGSSAIPSLNVAALRKTARQAGLLYFVMAVIAILVEFVLPEFSVPGDATATMRAILANESLYRLKTLLGFLTNIIFMAVAIWLYQVFKDSDRKWALLMLLLVIVGVTVNIVISTYALQPVALLNNPEHLKVFSESQTDALAYNSLRFQTSATPFPVSFWGFWLLPFAVLIFRSRLIPAIFGVLLIITGAAYIVSGFTSIALPALKQAISPWLMPLYFCEVPIIFWLMIVGIRIPGSRDPISGN